MSEQETEVDGDGLRQLAQFLRTQADYLEDAAEKIGTGKIRLKLKTFQDVILRKRVTGFVRNARDKAEDLEAEMARIQPPSSGSRKKKSQ